MRALVRPILTALAVLVCCPLIAAAADPPLTQPLRDEHALLAKHLDDVEQLVAGVCSSDAEEASSKAKTLVWALNTQLLPHADWEESVLYPAIDGMAGLFCYPFTASMREEHILIRRGVEGLTEMIADKNFDRALFGRKADQLLGLVRAHFEVEENVLFPIIDDGMSPHDFQVQVLDKLPEHDK